MNRWTLALIAILVTGCSPSRPPGEFVVTDQAQLMMKSATIECASKTPEDCPTGVGLVLTEKVEGRTIGVQRCTAFLIGPETAVTNSHCLPEDMRRDGADCSLSTEIRFPKAPGADREDVVKCSRVIKANRVVNRNDPQFGKTLDYAVLKLEKPVNRKPFAVSREGVPDRLALSVYVIDPVSDASASGVLRRQKCVAVQNNNLLPQFAENWSGLVIMADCKAIPGNSGSPAVDSSGRVRAVMFASAYAIGASPDVKPIDGRPFRSMASAANAACWELPGTAYGPRDVRCDRPVRSRLPIEEWLVALPESTFDKVFNEYVKPYPNFGFKRRRVPHADIVNAYGIMPELDCVKDVSLIPAEDLLFDFPVWAAQPAVDSAYRHAFVVEVSSTMRMRVRINRDELLRTGKTIGHGFDVAGHKGNPYGVPLSICN